METLNATAYLAPIDLVDHVVAELQGVQKVYERLVLAEGAVQPSVWAQNIWMNPFVIRFSSVNDAAKKLREIQRNWKLYSHTLHRRASLIEETLPKVSAKPLPFPAEPPGSSLGSWTLLDAETILASAHCTSVFPNGEIRFIEHPVGPPSRAYLKLWEALLRSGCWPGEGSLCLDAGASPGGWSWVIERLGAKVDAVDRSPLAPELMKKPRIAFRQGDGFSVGPDAAVRYDWVFSDMACYPEKLLGWVEQWLVADASQKLICTLKFQGSGHQAIIEKFSRIPGGQLVHLFHNKHELTFIHVPS